MVKVWIVVVIIGREFLISGLRSIASSEGFTIQASDLGKLKTVIQIVCVVSAILAHGWDQWQFGVLIIPVKWIAIAAIYFTVLVSTISAIDYFVGFWKQIDHATQGPPQVFVLTRRKKANTLTSCESVGFRNGFELLRGTNLRIVLSNIGTFGDINPLIAIALELKRRAHAGDGAAGRLRAEDSRRWGWSFTPSGRTSTPATRSWSR